MKALVQGTIGNGGKWLTWKEWLEEFRAAGKKEFQGIITHVYPPQKFPTATVVFWDDEKDIGVKKTLSPQQWQALSSLFTPGKVLKGIRLFFLLNGDEFQIMADEAPDALYVPSGTGWELA